MTEEVNTKKKFKVHIYFGGHDNCIINDLEEDNEILKWIEEDVIFEKKYYGIDFTKANWVQVKQKIEEPKNCRKVELPISEPKKKGFWQRIFG